MKTITKCYRLTPIDVDRIRAIRDLYGELSLNETDVIKLAVEQLFHNGLVPSFDEELIEDKYYIVYDGDLLSIVSGYGVSILTSPFGPLDSEVFEVLTESEFLEKYPEEPDPLS